jgi:hypothetical protein
MPDYSPLIQQITGWILLFSLGIVTVELTLIHLVAKAARMKNRSYKSFYWLSFVFRAAIMWLIVASLPFNPYDPRSPYVDQRPGEAEEARYINPWSKKTLLGSGEIWALCIGIGLVIIALIGSVSSLVQTSQPSASSYSSGLNSNDSSSGIETSGTVSGCEQDLTSKQESAGYYLETGGCLAYRWLTASETNKEYCVENGGCSHAYVLALSKCDIPTLEVDYKDKNKKVILTDYVTGNTLNAGERQLVEISTSQNSSWQYASVSKAYCAGHD